MVATRVEMKSFFPILAVLRGGLQESAEALAGALPAEGLARAVVELGRHRVQIGFRVRPQVGPFGKVLPQKAVGVLVRAPLPGRMGIAKVHLQLQRDAYLHMLRHLASLIPGQGLAQQLGQVLHLPDDRNCVAAIPT